MRVRIADEVNEALADGAAIVALESTIISHGMPFPGNVEVASEVEEIVRKHGATPATIAVIDGVPRIGLDPAALDRLGHPANDDIVHKATTRDLPWLIATGATGATTVAATMRLAHATGIRIFATGGIGGVHRGAATTFDVSADLAELASTPVAVVSAGIKSILDVGLTLERLETLGVPVVVNGSDEFPSFYSRGSGHPAPRRLDGAALIARMLHSAWDELGLRVGVSIANPIPAADEIPAEQIDEAIASALIELEKRGISGQDVTPFLLDRVVERTGGASLRANIALVRNNARLGAQIAVELRRLT